jgi:hypothetical protein
MDLLIGTLTLRPYVFAFLAAFLAAGIVDLGGRRALLFAAWVGPMVWVAEFSSTRIGIPFGLYHYTGSTHGQELFVANVPVMDSLSFIFLAYASLSLARAALRGRRAPAPVLALFSGVLMMLLDVVMDPVAVQGDRWFLGRVFYYPDGGIYFGVPLSNFAGWVVVGTVAAGGFLYLSGWREPGSQPAWPRPRHIEDSRQGRGRPSPGVSRGRCWPGIALYYAVFGFNLAITAWLGEWLLVTVGAGIHGLTAAIVWSLSQRPAEGLGLEKQQA